MLTAWRNSADFDALAAATQRDYDRYIGLWREKIGEFPARDIRPVHVIAVRDELADRPTTANHAVAVLSAGYIWGAPRDYSTTNPCSLVPKLTVETEGRLPWPAWALEIAATQFRAELRRSVALGLYTGQRLGDVLSMRLVDIDREGINVRQSKTGKRLWIPFHAALKAEIEAARKDGRIYLVSREDGRPFTAQDFQAMWTREMKKEPQGRIRREGFSFHGLRTLAVVVLAESGMDAIRISSITGQSLNVVEGYLKDHRQRELAMQAIKAWERVLQIPVSFPPCSGEACKTQV
jgi:integrase